MARFLTDTWLRDLADAADAADTSEWPAAQRLVIEQIVTGQVSPALDDDTAGESTGDVTRWALEISRDGLRVVPGGAPEPDVIIATDSSTASAIARGTLNAQRALASGRIRVSGDLTRLAGLHTALTTIGDVFAGIGGIRGAD